MRGLGHDVHAVRDERLIGHLDSEIWEAAQAESRFLVTQDMDFSDLRKLAPGSHHGILLVRPHSRSRRNLNARVIDVFQSESVEERSGCFVVATERKVPVLRPQGKPSS